MGEVMLTGQILYFPGGLTGTGVANLTTQDSTVQPLAVLHHIRHIYYFTDAATTVTDQDTHSWLSTAGRTLAPVIVIYWLDQITSYRESCHPQGREDVPLLGMLATR